MNEVHMTVEELEAKVEERTKHMSGTTPTLEALCWFIAVHDAKAVFDSYTVKDLAHEIVKGNPIGGPYEDHEDVKEWIEAVEQTNLGDEEVWDWLDKALDDHFGVKR